jgi:hypothetical protein
VLSNEICNLIEWLYMVFNRQVVHKPHTAFGIGQSHGDFPSSSWKGRAVDEPAEWRGILDYGMVVPFLIRRRCCGINTESQGQIIIFAGSDWIAAWMEHLR